MTISASPMDLGTLSGVKNWLGITGSDQDENLQACLTAASIEVLRMTGRGSRNWQTATVSPFNQSCPFNEVYDGVSGQKLFLNNFPINSVQQLSLSGRIVPESTGPQFPGFTIDGQGRSLVLSFGGALSPDTFQYISLYGNGYTSGAGAIRRPSPFGVGAQQIQVQYMAGFNASPIVDDLENITPAWAATTAYTTGDQVSDGTYIQQAGASGTSGALKPPFSQNAQGTTPDGDGDLVWFNTGNQAAPNTIVIESTLAILSDQGVSYFSSGVPLTPVTIAPQVGQYFLVAPGVYLFNVADVGEPMLVSYTIAGTPGDLVLAVIQLVSLNYKRRNWIGTRSIAMKDVGSTSYTLLMDPEIRRVIEFYRRTVIGGA